MLGRLRPFSTTAYRAMKIVPVPVREDNYAYLLIDEPSKKAAAVDIYDVDKVISKANELGVNITAALTTHRHMDHSGGNKVGLLKPALEERLTCSVMSVSEICALCPLRTVEYLDSNMLSRHPSFQMHQSMEGAI